MKTNELNQQEMQQTNGGTSMSPMTQAPGADALTIRNNPETTPMDGGQSPETFGDWDRTDIFTETPAG